jgi:uncharacterized protein YkwD
MIPGRQGSATSGPALPPRRAVDMSAGAPARHRAPRHGAHPSDQPPHQPPRYGLPPGGEPGYGLPPVYDPHRAFDPPPAYDPPTAYDRLQAYDQPPAYDAPPGFGPPPGYGPPPGGPPRRTRRPGRRALVLLCCLLVLPLLAGAGVYLTRGSAPAPASATGKVTAAPSAPAPCDPATGGSAGSCAGQPFHVGVASVPASLSPRPSAARTGHHRPTPSSSASASASTSARPASPSPTASATSPAGTTSGSAAAQVLALINQARSAAGLAPLTITAGLNSSASGHNSTMAGGCGLSHQCPGEPDLGARETAAGVHWTAAGENIGEGGPVANTTAAIAQMAVTLTQAMLNEKPPNDGHRRNILSSSFTHIGIAVFRDSSGTVWLTQDFSN